MVLRLVFIDSDRNCVVQISAMRKVPFAVVWSPGAGLRELELAIRRSAKEVGSIEEVVEL